LANTTVTIAQKKVSVEAQLPCQRSSGVHTKTILAAAQASALAHVPATTVTEAAGHISGAAR
jgi:hypothetical protein